MEKKFSQCVINGKEVSDDILWGMKDRGFWNCNEL
jgi:hypothetical protein